MKKAVLFFALLFCASVVFAQTISGEQKKWHRVTLTFNGPNVMESSTPNPFRDYRLNVTFSGPSGQEYVVPGFFAADGNAANTSAASGDKWRVHFTPDEVGQWSYTTSFRTGTDISVSTLANEGTPTSFNGTNGTFTVSATDKTIPDNRANGRLSYVNNRYLRFTETGSYFIKVGADSPENLLAYEDFDGTSNDGGTNYIKSWSPHIQDWVAGDPTWGNDKGKGLIGAINYLANKGMNAFSFLPMNVGGDGKDVWPWTAANVRDRYDVSKLAQWEILFEHAESKGMFLHFKTQEQENDQLLNNGNLGTERKLYYRELIARFGHHLALNWNLGEENTQTTQQRKDMASYIKQLDPYNHHIVVHTFPGAQDEVYNPLLGNASELTGASVQTGINNVHRDIKKWVEAAENAGKPWAVASDEIGGANVGVAADANYTGNTGSQADNRNQVREKTLWGALMAGGYGVEYYFGYQTGETDLTCQDFRSRATKWEDAKIALDFFTTYIPFWDMNSTDEITSDSDDYCFSEANEYYVIYLPPNQTTNINLGNSGDTFEVKWYDPRNGGSLQDGSVLSLTASGNAAVGTPPANDNQDWVVLIVRDGLLSYDEEESVAFSIYPNPAKNMLHLRGLPSGNHEFELLNLAGSVVTKARLRDVEADIELPVLSTGIYIARIRSETGETLTKKIVVQ